MAWGYGLKTSYVDEEYEFDDNVGYLPRNMYVHDIDDGEYLMIRGVNFGRKGAKKIIASIGSIFSPQCGQNFNSLLFSIFLI